ncbi:hypothetical protein JCM10908_003126 [Rhodotorula pacifica]|uniref:uncharacterized protein n=1 Tax=Rhodotorula pacifica TaxID=1495444 RepID=UPI003173160F
MPPRKKPAAPKKRARRDSDAGDDDPDSPDYVDPNEGKGQLDLTLPPLFKLDEIFAHMVSREAKSFAQVFKDLGRPLRVATMCSGTEAPILALKLMMRALEAQTGVCGEIDHVFSAEIDAFKQAYIERNFAPPLLFRDVTELPNDKARTAYGSFAEVPGEVDLLVAGTSCVDYSNLNNKQKGINDQGESGRTFFGMLEYSKKHRVKMIIIENVYKAPWKEVEAIFDEAGYGARWVGLDTKKYYIPHTRTRGYLVAFLKEGTKDPKKSFFEKKDAKNLTAVEMADEWKERVKNAERIASAPTEAFLLGSDDPRVHRARQELAYQKVNADGNTRAPTDWGRCEVRHAIQRQKEKLGEARPLTKWSDTGAPPKMPDGAWQDWAETQTERVHDLMDISYLRQAKLGVDVTSKSAVWNLSQNVDRTTASKVFGITPCLTPKGLPYLTHRGGPIVGLEALALQGLPIDELLLTRESTDQLTDLAGNAMSSTVVGTAMLYALLIGGHLLERGPVKGDAEPAKDEDGDVVIVDGDTLQKAEKKVAPPTDEELEARLRGAERLVEHPVDLASHKPASTDLLERAHGSARRCTCEGREGISVHPILTCTSCGHSTCVQHKARPEHHYEQSTAEREDPKKFAADLCEMLPMRLKLPGFDRETITKLVEEAQEQNLPLNKILLAKYVDIVVDALAGAEFHFQHADRRDYWTAVYGAEKAQLHLFFGQTSMEWRLFVDPPAYLAALAPMRLAFEHPVARLNIAPGTTDLLAGTWAVKLPLSSTANSVQLEFEYDGTPRDASWRAKLELVDFRDEKSPRRIKVKFNGDGTLLNRSIDGTYVREEDCGTPTEALYRRVEPAEETPLYFFFDPSPYLENTHDRFVFAETCSRIEGARPLIATMHPKWRLNPFKVDNERTEEEVAILLEPDMHPKIEIASTFRPLAAVKIVPGGTDVNEASKFATIKTGDPVSITEHKCQQAEVLLTAHVPLAKSPSPVWASEHWHSVDLQREGPEVFTKLGWMLARIPEWQTLHEWQIVEADSAPKDNCHDCAPAPPVLDWIRAFVAKAKTWDVSIAAREDGKQAAAYEHSLKNRPEPFIVHTRQIENEFQFKIGLNVASLAHRALAQLPTHRLLSASAPKVEWRLNLTANQALGRENSHVFTLLSNRNNPEAENPKRFKDFKLRPEQLRSLHWMIEQEANPKPWVEEEVVEALVTQLGWTAEAKATREVVVRGGVVADAVGYGKTAITLGLIAARQEADADLPDDDERIPIKATLIVVPKHLSQQWPDEVNKFTRPALNTLVIQNHMHLKKFTIEDFQNADVVIVSESLFTSGVYWPYTADFAASTVDIKTDKKAGRYFRHCVDTAMESLGAQIRRIRDKGARAAHKALTKARASRNENFEHDYILPESRKKANATALKKGEKPAPLPPKPTSFPRSAKIGDDEWGLLSSAASDDWTQIKGPPLPAFSWARVVLDEFSYTEGASLVGIHSCRGRARWILSGTPPLRDFSEVKSVASLLNVHLGVDDQNEGVADQVVIRNREATKAEQFRSYCDVRTKAWHANRDRVAQRFLDQYARQNRAEIDEIPLEIEHVGVRLPGAEMAIYRELEHHLTSLDVNLSRLAKIKADKQSDRDRRLREALGQSQTPEEALLKRCSHFTLDLDETRLQSGDEAPDVCDFIHGLREQQLAECQRELKFKLLAASWMHREAKVKDYYDVTNAPHEHFREWIRRILNGEGAGDATADEFLRALLAECNCSVEAVGKAAGLKHREEDVAEFLAKKEKKHTDHDYAIGRTQLVRDACVVLNKLVKELVGRIRSARYFGTVRQILRKDEDDGEAELAVLSCCGHFGPVAAVKEAAHRNKCIETTCSAQVFIDNVLTGESLGTDRSSGHYGYKLETLVTLIKQTPKDDRVLVFVQFDDLFDKVHEALCRYEVGTQILQGTAMQQTKTLTAFQQMKGAKVLLLKATDSSSSGANLTMANWAFFVSPLLTDSKAKYKALSTQAIGRIHRYGQGKTAKIVHLLTHETKDVPIFAHMNDLDQNEVRAMVAKRKEIVPPKRERTGTWEPRKKKAPAVRKKASPKKKDADEDEDKGRASSGNDSDPDSDHDAPAPRKPAARRAPAKKPAGRGGKKAASIVISGDDESEAASSAAEESEEEPELTSDDEDSEDERPKKKKAALRKKKPEDDYSASDEDADDAPVASPSRKLPRRSAAASKPIVIDDSSDEEDDEEDEEDEPAASSSKGKGKGKGKAPAAKPAKKRRIIESDSEEDEEEEEPAAPKASTSRAKASTPVPKKAKVASSSTSKKPASSSAGPSKPAGTEKLRGVFDGLVPIPSPKAKKQAQLYSFWKKKEGGATTGSTSAQPAAAGEKKRKAEDEAPAADGKDAAVSKKKAKQDVTATNEATPAGAAAVPVASTSTTGDASVEAEQDSNERSSPSVAGSEETATSSGAAISTAVTTPADELDKRLGDDVDEEVAGEMSAAEEAV